ncbi:hypothetical protein BU26DRAFT_12998 [Trematosphaeria pertusa]|uniref:Uncharacterized protein n=1 Tax=Trematosphaeria pertusa TaxID=390896 RepID=A0A6A6J036_9PLEO|nr:uncharacterized protein BU26DRAFT_12998 [Trematosphaeria pertusa]KAF2255986.1 hypothetical protein BU26DRAFT_12998 [Trematosphaeria pertusa]
MIAHSFILGAKQSAPACEVFIAQEASCFLRPAYRVRQHCSSFDRGLAAKRDPAAKVGSQAELPPQTSCNGAEGQLPPLSGSLQAAVLTRTVRMRKMMSVLSALPSFRARSTTFFAARFPRRSLTAQSLPCFPRFMRRPGYCCGHRHMLPRNVRMSRAVAHRDPG